MAYCVYMHVNKTNGKKYVGITSKKPEYRWGRCGNSYFQNKHFFNAIQKYGWDGFDHIILANGLTKEEACRWEATLIALYRCNFQEYGYNGSEGGEMPAKGYRHSEEWKKARSDAMRGKRRTKDFCRNVSDGKRGRPNGHEGQIGEACAKSGKVYQIEESTGNVLSVFYGFDEMKRLTGYAKTPVREAASGKRKRAYGYLWRYEKRGEINVVI